MDQQPQENTGDVIVLADKLIEIPEPDYDDDDDDEEEAADDAVEVAPSDDVAIGDSVANDNNNNSVGDGCHGDAGERVSGDDDDELKSSRFDEIRAKLEEFSLEEHHALPASLSEMDVEIPEPDYSDSDNELQDVDNNVDLAVKPQKLINPCLLSKEHKELRRELLLNQKLGVNVLAKKSELTKEMNKRELRKQEREFEARRMEKRSSFDLRLEEQANKLNMAEKDTKSEETGTDDASAQQPELLKVHSKITKTQSAS